MSDPLIGEIIEGRYRVLRVLGQGGAGTIYLVEMVAGMVGSKLALKLIRRELSDSPQRQQQFISEIRLAMKIVHEHIVQIRDVGSTAAGQLYYTMDYCPGRTLKEVLAEEGVLSIPRTRAIAYRALMALHAAHRAGIIHRDLKPANIMVVANDEGHESIRVLDFGIATLAAPSLQESNEGGAAAEAVQGTPSYMPPEQFLGEKLGYYTDLGIVDLVGLVTPEITPRVAMRDFTSGFWELRPEYLVALEQSKFILPIVDDPAFAQGYRRVAELEGFDGLGLTVFRRLAP